MDGQEKVEKRGLFSLGARDGIRDVRVDEYWDKLVIYSFRRYSLREYLSEDYISESFRTRMRCTNVYRPLS
ncbi:hypothetical protein [Andrias davidianus ranavirus]|uniref:Uncharacterized protein n=1 Tax=Andrias davidianus ranavirus TaxID=1398177 RepID=V5KX96_9VIRU|nr:hypothetical protein [Andrias davidianus ranavirus]